MICRSDYVLILVKRLVETFADLSYMFNFNEFISTWFDLQITETMLK